MDQILIEDLLARGVIGISETERAQPQDIVINITLFTDTQRVGETDSVEDCVNYRTIAKKALNIAEKAARRTVEALASDLAKEILLDKRIMKVQVKVEKPGAVRFSKSVGVLIERNQPE